MIRNRHQVKENIANGVNKIFFQTSDVCRTKLKTEPKYWRYHCRLRVNDVKKSFPFQSTSRLWVRLPKRNTRLGNLIFVVYMYTAFLNMKIDMLN